MPENQRRRALGRGLAAAAVVPAMIAIAPLNGAGIAHGQRAAHHSGPGHTH